MANQWHTDDEVDHAFLRLMDALSSWERSTGRHTTVVLIPGSKDEPVVVAHDGKYLKQAGSDHAFLVEQLGLALSERDVS